MSKSRSKRTGDGPVLQYFEWRVTDLAGYGYAEAEPTARDVLHEAVNGLTLYEAGNLQWRRSGGEPWIDAEDEPDAVHNLAP